MVDERRQPAAENHEVAHVQSFFDIEIEVAHRRCEWEREVTAAEQHALARAQNGPTKRWSHLASRTLAYLRALATPRVLVTCWNAAGKARATTFEGGGAIAT